ncbi:hypothetical protein MRBLRH8O_002238 [Agrobacterium radiobacter]|uniref:contact-dependent growth inhibition system immunity protein n=1 Tax=Agrobacterium TaxID=357 RepID=UPI0018643798|nr:contact-dependent growth inhibition system immunity protein [Agrobacterium sp. LAD9]
MTKRSEKFEQLLGGYFHQDWDIEGEKDSDVIVAFRQAVPAVEIEATIAEVDRMLQQ